MLSDQEINKLICDLKRVKSEILRNIQFKIQNNSRHEIWDYQLVSEIGNVYQIRIRKNTLNRVDFSVILTYIDENRNFYNLKRYNGIHDHTNKLEKNKFRDFHIHTATQRYQEEGYQIEGYAETTNGYSTWQEALDKMLNDCNFKREGNATLSSFN